MKYFYLLLSISIFFSTQSIFSTAEDKVKDAVKDKTETKVEIKPIEPEIKYCVGISNSFECARAIEKGKLQELLNSDNTKELVSRKIQVQLANKTYKPIEDISDINHQEKNKFYSFRDYLKDIDYFLFHVQHYEGDSYSLISRQNGKEFNLIGVPVLSPNKKKLVTTSVDLIANYNPNSIQIWRISPTDMTLEMKLEPEPTDWGASDAIWIDENTIHFTKNILTNEMRPACSANRMKLSFNTKIWKIQNI